LSNHPIRKSKQSRLTNQGILTEGEGIKTVDLLALPVFFCFAKQPFLIRRSAVLSLPLQLGFPELNYLCIYIGLIHKYKTRRQMLAKDKHTSLAYKTFITSDFSG
jgi:hypothetical protein